MTRQIVCRETFEKRLGNPRHHDAQEYIIRSLDCLDNDDDDSQPVSGNQVKSQLDNNEMLVNWFSAANRVRLDKMCVESDGDTVTWTSRNCTETLIDAVASEFCRASPIPQPESTLKCTALFGADDDDVPRDPGSMSLFGHKSNPSQKLKTNLTPSKILKAR